MLFNIKDFWTTNFKEANFKYFIKIFSINKPMFMQMLAKSIIIIVNIEFLPFEYLIEILAMFTDASSKASDCSSYIVFVAN